MKPFRQILSALTAAAMSVTLLTGILPAKADEEPAPETGTNSDLSMTAENSLGQLMLDASQSDPSEDAGDYDGSAGVTDIVIEDGMADVSYYTPVKADLILAFYSDDEAQMYASLNAEVSPAEPADDGIPGDQNQTYTFTVPTDIPSYFIVKAYLIGAAFTPLCEAYSTNLYTESITKARNSKPSDFDPSLVVNLDKTTDHNFLVLREETVQIIYDGKHNLLDSYDETTGAYHFTNADAQLTSLQKGDVVYYNYNDGVDRLVLTVLDISVNGTDVTITTADMELSDAFSVVHIEETVQPELDLTPGETYENGLTYIGSHEVGEPAVNRLHPLAGASEPITLVEHEFNWSSDDSLWKSQDRQQYDKDIEDFKKNPGQGSSKEIPAGAFYGSIKGTAELTLKVKSVLTYELFVWEDGQLCSTADLENSVTLSGSAAFKAVGKLFVVGFSKGLKGGIVVTAGVGVEFDGGITCSTGELTLSSVVSGKVWHGFLGLIKDSDIHLNNLTCDATNFLQPDLEISGFIGLFAEVGLGIHVQGFDDLGLSFSAKFGLEVTFDPITTESQDSDYEHTCRLCHAGKIDIVGDATFTAGFMKLLNGDIDGSTKLADPRLHWRDFYISDDHQESGWGICPHRRYAVLFRTKRSIDNPIAVPDVALTITGEGGKVYTCTTDENGDAKLYLDNGDYEIKADTGNASVTAEISHGYQLEVLEIEMFPGEKPKEPVTEPSNEPNPEKGNVLESGTFSANGDEITWELDDNGTLWISGSGTIPYSITPPWAEYTDTITRIVIGSGITEIFAGVFADLGHITGITLPEGLKTIGSGAFENCTALSSVILPDSLESICDDSFAGCSSLRTITIPKHVTTIVGTGTPFPINMTDIQVDPENPAYSDVDGVLFNKEQTMLLYFPPGRTGDYTVPDGVEKIGYSKDEQGSVAFCAFRCCNLTSITLPDSVNYLCAHAFNACHQLESVRLSENLEKIPYYAFSSCYELKDMTIPDSVVEIKPMAFESALQGSVTVPGSVKTVGTKAFYRSPLSELIFEEGVETIDGSFGDNTHLRTVYLPASLKSLKSTFSKCVNVKDVYYGGTEEQWKALGLENEFAYKTYLGNTIFHIGASAATLGSDTTLAVSGLIKAGSLNEQTAEFTDLTPNTTYILYSVADKNAEQPLSPANLLYINQYTADENGCINADFTPVWEVDSAETFVMPVSDDSALGDVNGDGTVNASDAAQILIAAAALGAGNISGLTAEQEANADVNDDGIINASDAAVVLIYAAAIGAGQDVKLTDFVH